MKVNHKNIFPFKKSFNRQRRHANPRSRKPQSVKANILTAKAAQGFVVSVTIHAGRIRIAGDFLQIQACNTPERAWREGYNLAQALADEHAPGARLFVEPESAYRRKAA